MPYMQKQPLIHCRFIACKARHWVRQGQQTTRGGPDGAPEGTLCFASMHILCYIISNVLHTVSNFRRAAYARNASTARAARPWLRECHTCETAPDDSSKAYAGGRQCCMTVLIWS